MYLTKEQESLLRAGGARQKAMELLVKLGDIYGAEEMVPVGSAQAAGVSYKSIGDPGLEFLEGFAEEGAKVSVPTFLNPAGIDLIDWKDVGFPQAFAEKQKRIISAFRKMGIVLTASCTPYLLGNLPRYKEHLAWSESSAVSFANSVIGARTNREGGPSALAAGICGFTPKHGLHLDENRKPDYMINVEKKLETSSDFGLLGNYVGGVVKDKIPLFTGIKRASTDQLKALGAAMAASGAVALYYVEGLTPDSDWDEKLETLEFGDENYEKTKDVLNTGEEPDLVVIGCPHASITEIRKVSRLLKGKSVKKPLWVCTSRAMKVWSDKMGFTKIIEKAGGHVVCDTCMVVSPIEDMGFKCVGTNSGKAAAYLPGFCKQKVVFSSLKELVEGAS